MLNEPLNMLLITEYVWMVTERNIKSDSFLFLAGDYGKQYFIIVKLSVRTRLISFIH